MGKEKADPLKMLESREQKAFRVQVMSELQTTKAWVAQSEGFLEALADGQRRLQTTVEIALLVLALAIWLEMRRYR